MNWAGSRTRRLGRLLRRGLLGLGLLTALLGAAEARTVKIISADVLELRQVDGQELVIISGAGVELRVDDDVVRASRVEFNRTRRTLTLVGQASYRSAKDAQTLSGENLVIDLGEEQVSGEDVLISDAALEIRGQEVERIPGQLRATGGYFTTCARCGRTPNDFAFRAERLIVYPGDRLVAYRAQFLIVDVPVLFLPVIVLPLNDPERQPRLSIEEDARDGTVIEADLPFSIGASTLGTTLLRYYENRDPRVGVGVALRSYAPVRFVDRVRLYTLLNPKPLNADGSKREGTDFDLALNVAGRVPLELALRDLDYTLSVVRRDSGLRDNDPARGVARVTFGAKVDYPRFTAELNYVDRFGPEPTTALSTPLKTPEIVVDPKPYTRGALSADFRFTVGRYTAPSNPLSRSAVAQGVNITTTRLEEQHRLSYSAQPWKDAEFSVLNTFTGRYYGTGARTVQLSIQGTLSQRFNRDNTLGLTAGYERREGVSPFAFDAISGRLLSAPIGLTLTTVPAKDVRFSVSYRRDLFLPPEQQPAAQFSLGVTRKPVNLSASLNYNFSKGELESANANVTLGDPEADRLTLVPARPAQAATATTPAVPERPAYYSRSSAWPAPKLTFSVSGSYSRTGGPAPLTLRATVTGDLRSNNFSVYAVYDPKLHDLPELGVEASAAWTQDVVLNPLTFTTSQRLYPGAGRVAGNTTLTWRARYQFTESHDLLLQAPQSQAPQTARDSGTLNFSVGTVSGSATSWRLTYGGAYDLRRWGWTRPTLGAVFSATRPGQSLAVSATANLPGLDQKRTELTRVDASSTWQFGSRAALSGRVLYSRTRSGTFPDDKATDTLSLDPLRFSVGIGREGQRPGAYFSASLRQSFSWVDGVRQNPAPLSPVLGLTIDRCCWALQAEADLGLRRYRLAVGLPGQTFYPLFDLTPEGPKVPLLPLRP